MQTIQNTKRIKSKIKVDNNFIFEMIESDMYTYDNNVDLNHLDVSNVTDMHGLFINSPFNGDISNQQCCRCELLP
jgi:hypothetical protein